MLNKLEIKKLIESENLVEEFIDLDTQLTPNGFDLTVKTISEFDKSGALDFSNAQRIVPQGKEILPQKEDLQDKFGWWYLKPGMYKVKTNEIVNIPNNLVAMAFTRTSLLRMGGFTQNGVWDAGFKGRSEFVLVVSNPYGLRIQENARVIQLVFFSVTETEEYNGIYKHLK